MTAIKSMLTRSLGAVGLEPAARSVWKHAKGLRLPYQCPMCGAHLRQFFPDGEPHAVLVEKSIIGGGWRQNVLCPQCLSTDRERLIYLFLKNRPHLLSRGTKLLHIAPEDSLSAWLLSDWKLKYITADLSMDNVDFNIDLTKIPCPEHSFDAIVCNHVLEHIPDDAAAMTELFRVLKPGGWGIFQVPISPTLPATYEDFSITDPVARECAFGQCDHVRIYARDYVERLRRVGFAVEPFSWRADCEAYGGATNKYGLNEREVVFFASRPPLQVVDR